MSKNTDTLVARAIAAELLPELRANLATMHTVLDQPVKGEVLEEVVSKALAKTSFGSQWTHGSHAVSTDITLPGANNLKVSVKSGRLGSGPNGERLTISGSRLGTHRAWGLSSMLTHYKSSSADYYVCVARRKKDWKDSRLKKYVLYVFSSKKIDLAREDSWGLRYSENGTEVFELDYTKKRRLQARIVESMSYQMWCDVDVVALGGGVEIVVDTVDPALEVSGKKHTPLVAGSKAGAVALGLKASNTKTKRGVGGIHVLPRANALTKGQMALF